MCAILPAHYSPKLFLIALETSEFCISNLGLHLCDCTTSSHISKTVHDESRLRETYTGVNARLLFKSNATNTALCKMTVALSFISKLTYKCMEQVGTEP